MELLRGLAGGPFLVEGRAATLETITDQACIRLIEADIDDSSRTEALVPDYQAITPGFFNVLDFDDLLAFDTDSGHFSHPLLG